jgi:peptidoglycan/LPS O-acetylase OafA/YrhL
MFAVALWLLPNVELSILKDSFVNKYRVIADLTFPLYVLHLPLILLFRTLVPFKVNDYVQYFTCVFCIIIVAGILGYILEKQRYIWIKLFKKLFKV